MVKKLTSKSDGYFNGIDKLKWESELYNYLYHGNLNNAEGKIISFIFIAHKIFIKFFWKIKIKNFKD